MNLILRNYLKHLESRLAGLREKINRATADKQKVSTYASSAIMKTLGKIDNLLYGVECEYRTNPRPNEEE